MFRYRKLISDEIVLDKADPDPEARSISRGSELERTIADLLLEAQIEWAGIMGTLFIQVDHHLSSAFIRKMAVSGQRSAFNMMLSYTDLSAQDRERLLLRFDKLFNILQSLSGILRVYTPCRISGFGTVALNWLPELVGLENLHIHGLDIDPNKHTIGSIQAVLKGMFDLPEEETEGVQSVAIDIKGVRSPVLGTRP